MPNKVAHAARFQDPDRPLPLPALSRLGFGAIAFGLLLDVNEHVFAGHPHAAGPGFGPGEHLAHLVVLVGMVVVLAGIVAGGIRTSGRLGRSEGSPRDAIR
ncbi:MAG TPA: hypothetical protein VK871_13070 [Candidatus Limnocylindrales bacterium]|nr:hypothetical protein [Candidatus Limnocylindrales bacterium]